MRYLNYMVLVLISLLLTLSFANADTSADFTTEGRAAFVSRDGYNLYLGTQDDDDLIIVQNDVVTFSIDGATGAVTFSGAVAQPSLTASTGNVTITAGNLVFGAASAKVIPGATSLLIRNNADAATNLSIADSGAIVFSSTLIGTGTSTLGWAVVAAANQACTTTCVTPCVFGVNTAATEADIVDCASATADECLCAGAS